MQKIRQTLSVESFPVLSPDKNSLAVTANIYPLLAEQFHLSWSHYVELLTIEDNSERQFYEIEAQENSWSLRELKRQISTSLYQRLALSRDKDEIRQLAQQGPVIEKAADIIKNPLVLEFLGIQEKAAYSEEDLETAIAPAFTVTSTNLI